MVPRWFADLPPFSRLTCLGKDADVGSSKATDRAPPCWGQGFSIPVTRLGGIKKFLGRRPRNFLSYQKKLL